MAMEVFTVGQVLAAADLNEQCVNTKFAIKPADTSRASNTTLANDPDLTLPVDASKSYYLQASIIYTAVSGTGDIKYAFTIPAGTVFNGTALATAVSGTSPMVLAYGNSGLAITAAQSASGGGVGAVAFTFSGVLVTSVTAGNLVFQWSQNTSNGTATVVKQGSSLFLRRVS